MKKISLLHACVIGFLCLLFSHQTALAHEHITIGDYEIVVGWMDEPPIAGQKYAVVVNVSDISSGEELPVEDISSLSISISYGGQVKALDLQAVGTDSPGQFTAPILPTVPGEYAIILGGRLGSAAVEAEVHLEEVQPVDVLQFPELESSGQDTSPSSGNWLLWLALTLGVVGVALGASAHRKAR